ncbi:MAG: hypothetical protein MUO26_10220 [Methanotrichaceae archaeon]|nr:hypothetical protein [Methanotrichaceae archaeon]
MKAMVLVLAIMMLIGLMAFVDAIDPMDDYYPIDAGLIPLKYSELVNLSAEEFVASIKNNITALIHDIDEANETHDYDRIVRSDDLIKKNMSLLYSMGEAFREKDAWESPAGRIIDAAVFSQPSWDDAHRAQAYIVNDARARIKERNEEIAEEQEQARIAEEQVEEEPYESPIVEYTGPKSIDASKAASILGKGIFEDWDVAVQGNDSEGYLVLVNIPAPKDDIWSNEKFLRDTTKKFAEIFEKGFKDSRINIIGLTQNLNFNDKYGNKQELPAVIVIMSSSTAEKITNWGNFKQVVELDYNNLFEVADEYTVSPPLLRD